MDGIENVAAVRGNDPTTEGTLDRVLSTLLVELDGVEENSEHSGGSIAVIGITHNACWIDPALKRPGRLDTVVHLERDW
jgi:SpoVK/Ycf46/Vps4 family AAA+-type ATPase